MKKKGYLILEVLVYMSIASLLIIGVMNFTIWINKIYINELKNNKECFNKNIELEIIIDEVFNLANIIKIDISNDYVDVYQTGKSSPIYKHRIARNSVGKFVYTRTYCLDFDYTVTKIYNEEVVAYNVADFNALEKKNLIYITIKFLDGMSEVFVYEK